jgi:hypothetical protein
MFFPPLSYTAVCGGSADFNDAKNLNKEQKKGVRMDVNRVKLMEMGESKSTKDA